MNAQSALAEPEGKHSGQIRQQCPICHDRARIRHSIRVTPTVIDYYVQCMNVDCGATWKAQMNIVYMLSPSAIDNPEIDIPMAPENVPRKTFPPPGTEPPDPRQIPMFDQN